MFFLYEGILPLGIQVASCTVDSIGELQGHESPFVAKAAAREQKYNHWR